LFWELLPRDAVDHGTSFRDDDLNFVPGIPGAFCHRSNSCVSRELSLGKLVRSLPDSRRDVLFSAMVISDDFSRSRNLLQGNALR
jgi:hypothetical protein